MNDDEVIIHGLSIIRQGIIDSDVEKVVRGYGIISGEELLWSETKPASRLDKIRQGVTKKKTKTNDINLELDNESSKEQEKKLNRKDLVELSKSMGLGDVSKLNMKEIAQLLLKEWPEDIKKVKDKNGNITFESSQSDIEKQLNAIVHVESVPRPKPTNFAEEMAKQASNDGFRYNHNNPSKR